MSRSALAISRAKIEGFLTALANLRDDDEAALKVFVRRFGDMLSDVPSAEEWDARSEEAAIRALVTVQALRSRFVTNVRAARSERVPGHSVLLFGADEEVREFKRVSELSSHVRRIWRARTLPEKGLRILLLHELVSAAGNPTFLLSAAIGATLGALGPFAQSVLYLLKAASRATVCQNPECPAPLFFRSPSKRRQAYCSPECAGFGQRKAKLKWWAEQGRERRKQLSPSRTKKSKQKGE
jgi:hypothetical protein